MISLQVVTILALDSSILAPAGGFAALAMMLASGGMTVVATWKSLRMTTCAMVF